MMDLSNITDTANTMVNQQVYFKDNNVSNFYYLIGFDNNKYLYAYQNKKLIKINPNSTSFDILPDIFDGNPSKNIVYANDYLYGVKDNTGELYKINPTTGSSELFITIENNNIIKYIKYYNNIIYALVYTDTNDLVGIYKINITDGSKNIFIYKDAISQILNNSLANLSNISIELDDNGNLYILLNENIIKFDINGKLINLNFISGKFLYFTLYTNIFYCIEYFNIIEKKSSFTDKIGFSINEYDINGNFITKNKIILPIDFSNPFELMYLSYLKIINDNNGSIYFGLKNIIYKINLISNTNTYLIYTVTSLMMFILCCSSCSSIMMMNKK
jgi:hypothetical protein